MALACAGLGIAVALWLGQAQSPLMQVLGGGVFGLGVFLAWGCCCAWRRRAPCRACCWPLAGLKAYSAGAASPLSSSCRRVPHAQFGLVQQLLAMGRQGRPRSKSATDSSSVRSPRSRRSRMPSSSGPGLLKRAFCHIAHVYPCPPRAASGRRAQDAPGCPPARPGLLKERSAISLMFIPVLHAQRQVAVAQLCQQRVACLRLR